MEKTVGFPSRPDFITYSFENFGQVIKVSADLEPEVFPYKVVVPLDGNFFQSIYHRVYCGKNTTSADSGILIERDAVIGTNDAGELMISNKVFEGSEYESLTDKTQKEMHQHVNTLKSIPFPAGWRTFAHIHSHPLDDVVNHLLSYFSKTIPKVNGVPVTWTLGDFQSLLISAALGHQGLTTSGLITQSQLGLMVASRTTIEALKSPSDELRKIIESKKRTSDPPYKLFEKYGVILYGGNHFGRQKGEMQLQRLI
ncbi:MAG: hypothetical protein QY322_02600 [bacterium]|nr:MAG: hypothetical protein QY322_02600 [bacterium]